MAEQPRRSKSEILDSISRRQFVQRNLAIGGTLLASGGLSGLLTACGGDRAGSSATDVTESDVRNATGTINVLTFSFYQVPALNSGSVTGDFASLANPAELLTKSRSVDLGLDVVNSASNVMDQLYALERLVPIDADVISNYDRLEPTLRNDPVFSQGDEVFAVPFAVAVGFTAWDSDTVSEPTSAEDLLDPAYEGSIGLINESDTLIVIAKLLGFDVNNFTLEDLDEVKAYLEELKPNVKTLFVFGDEVQLFARGDIAVAFQTFGTLLTRAQQSNPAIQGNLVGSLSYVDTWSILDGADVPASLNWINHSLNEDAQVALVEASGGYPSVSKALDPSLYPPELQDLTLAEVIKQSPPNPGVPTEGDGLVTRDVLDTTWNEYGASFV
jgi:spermidine/putrescine-binding protein